MFSLTLEEEEEWGCAILLLLLLLSPPAVVGGGSRDIDGLWKPPPELAEAAVIRGWRSSVNTVCSR